MNNLRWKVWVGEIELETFEVADDETRDGFETLGVPLVTLDDVSKVVGPGMFALCGEREVQFWGQGFGSTAAWGIVSGTVSVLVCDKIDVSDDLTTGFTDEMSRIVSNIAAANRVRDA